MQCVVPSVSDTEPVSQKESRSIPFCFCHSASPTESNIPLSSRNTIPSRWAEVCPLPGDALYLCLCKSPCSNPW